MPFASAPSVDRPSFVFTSPAAKNNPPHARSLFIHYYPSDWKRTYSDTDVHYRIPPGWDVVLPPAPGLERLVMATTSAYEPDCHDTWCSLNDTIEWDVRGEFGRYLSGDGVSRDMDFAGKGIRTPRHWGDEL